MEEPVKGTVTSLSSLIPAEEAQKASRRVLDAIYERREQLDQLKSFIADNNNLVNLVQKLPEELHHDIMVPFGKAAFFPGRLIHTNEFLVLLGEGYYAERTSKQTVEMLKRRGKVLESQVESLKAVMQDLKAEASFFDATAAEAVEGLVEIREDYVEEPSAENEKVSIAGAQSDSPSFAVADNMEAGSVDEEYTHILSIMDKLEKEEEETENANEHSEVEQNDSDFGRRSPDHEVKSSEISAPLLHSEAESTTREDTFKNFFQQDFSDRLDFEGSKVYPLSKEKALKLPEVMENVGKSPTFNKANFTDKALKLPEVKENVQAAPESKNEGPVHISEAGSHSSKAFTGSIIEHTPNIGTNPIEQTAARGSKPVSRFKMQRR